MKTEYRFVEELKKMMSEKPLEEISVLSLTKKCGVNRQTFYYHFHDIYDLLTLVFLREKIEGIDKVKSFVDMVTIIYKYYDANKAFVDATLSSAGKDLFQEFVYNVCYQCTMNIIASYKISGSVPPDAKKNVARFYGSAFCNSIIYYLNTYKNKSLNGLLNNFSFVEALELSKVLQNSAKYSQ